ncbi:MAG TPA: hypothetical protein PKA49_11025, partial [Tepidiformaceae bacterium]|nr:hypothetical protein [Tepidiformaceae bacterium]
MTMDQDGHQGPDDLALPESEDGWYFDLPSGAWERQEEKNRELRERIRGNMTQGSGHEPFRGRKPRAEEPQGGLAGWSSRHADEPLPEPAPVPPAPAPFAARPDEPLAAWAGDGWDDPESGSLWQEEPVPPVPAASLTADPFAESVEDFGDPELINAMRAWANQQEAPEPEPEPEPEPVLAEANFEPAEPAGIADAMRAWAATPAAPSFRAEDGDGDDDDGADSNITAFRRPGEYHSSWRRERPVSEPSRWQEAFQDAPRGENVIDSMRAWAESGPVLPQDDEPLPPQEIPEEFLQPFEWELEEGGAADSDFAIFSGAAEAVPDEPAPAPAWTAEEPPVAMPALAAWGTEGDTPAEDELVEESAPAPFAWPPAANDPEDEPTHTAIPGFDDEDSIFAAARSMAGPTPPAAEQKPREKKGGLMSRLFGRKKQESASTPDVGPGDWVSADLVEETAPPWSMAGMAGVSPAAAAASDDWEPHVDFAPAAADRAAAPVADDDDGDDWAAKARAAWASLDAPVSLPTESFAWDPEPPTESAGESPATSTVAWEWPRTDAAMETLEESPEQMTVTTSEPGDSNEFTWDPEEFGDEPAAASGQVPVFEAAPAEAEPAVEPATPAEAVPVPLFAFEPEHEPVPAPVAESEPSPVPVPLFAAEPEPEPAPAFSFEPEPAETPDDPWAAFLAAREQDRTPADPGREAGNILPFDEPRLMDETTASTVEPAASAANAEIAGAPAGDALRLEHERASGWDAIADAVTNPDAEPEDDDYDWNPEAFATATPMRMPPAPETTPEPAAPAFAWGDPPTPPPRPSPGAPQPPGAAGRAAHAGPSAPAATPVSPLQGWGAPAVAASFGEDPPTPPESSEWEADEPAAQPDEPPADDPWAAVAAASGFEPPRPLGIPAYR